MDEPRPAGLVQRLMGRAAAVVSGGSDHQVVARGAGIAFVLQAMGAGLVFAMQVFLGRWMGAGEYGSYSYTVAWAGLVAVLTGLGLPATVLRFIPAFISHRDWPRLRGILRASILITLGAGVGVSAIATVVAFLASPGSPPWEVILGIWLAPLFALRTLQQETVRAFRRVILAYGPSFVLRPSLVILGGAAYVATGHTLTSRAALCITVVAFLVLIVGQEAIFWHGQDPELHAAEPVYETRAWMKVALPLLLIAGFSVVLSETDIVMVKIFEGSKEAGIYTAASKTSGLVALILLSVNAIAAPMFSSLYAQGRHEDLAALASRVARWIFWPTLAISVFLAIAAKPILGLFGSEFGAASWILIVLLVGQLVSAGAGSVGYLMTQTGHQREAAWVYGWVGATHIALNAIAIPLLGTIGAAVATTISLSVWNIWLHELVVRRLGIHASVVSHWRGLG